MSAPLPEPTSRHEPHVQAWLDQEDADVTQAIRKFSSGVARCVHPGPSASELGAPQAFTFRGVLGHGLIVRGRTDTPRQPLIGITSMTACASRLKRRTPRARAAVGS